MAAVTHFEIYAEKPEGLADFYRSLFGWQLDKSPGLDYWRIKSDATDASVINGGLTYRPFPGPRSWVHYVHVESLDAAVADVLRLGGAVLRPEDRGAEGCLVCGGFRSRGQHIRRLAAGLFRISTTATRLMVEIFFAAWSGDAIKNDRT